MSLYEIQTGFSCYKLWFSIVGIYVLVKQLQWNGAKLMIDGMRAVKLSSKSSQPEFSCETSVFKVVSKFVTKRLW